MQMQPRWPGCAPRSKFYDAARSFVSRPERPTRPLRNQTLCEIETIRVHHLCPGRNEVGYELLARI